MCYMLILEQQIETELRLSLRFKYSVIRYQICEKLLAEPNSMGCHTTIHVVRDVAGVTSDLCTK